MPAASDVLVAQSDPLGPVSALDGGARSRDDARGEAAGWPVLSSNPTRPNGEFVGSGASGRSPANRLAAHLYAVAPAAAVRKADGSPPDTKDALRALSSVG